MDNDPCPTSDLFSESLRIPLKIERDCFRLIILGFADSSAFFCGAVVSTDSSMAQTVPIDRLQATRIDATKFRVLMVYSSVESFLKI